MSEKDMKLPWFMDDGGVQTALDGHGDEYAEAIYPDHIASGTADERVVVCERPGSPGMDNWPQGRFILRACNAHDGLVEALGFILDHFAKAPEIDPRMAAVLAVARDAFVKAKEG